jgi:hypothetical protein
LSLTHFHLSNAVDEARLNELLAVNHMAMARAYMQLDNWFKAVQHTNRALDDATPDIRDQVFL